LSEYQYHEFLAIDRPFSAEARKVFSSLSSRAEVTSRSAAFVYHRGDFRGDPWKLVEQHADFHFQLAWYCVRIHMRLPAGAVTPDLLAQYEEDEYCGVSAQRAGGGFVVRFSTGEEHSFNGWLEGSGMAESLAPLREEMLNGDHRFLYLGWLYGVQWLLGMGAAKHGGPDEDADSEAAESGEDAEERPDGAAAILDSCEPPVPPGLGKLSPAQEYFVKLIGIDRSLLAAAAEASLAAREVDEEELAGLVHQLSEAERSGYLLDLARNDATVQVRLRRRLLEAWQAEHGKASEAPGRRRTVRELLAKAEAQQRAEDEHRRKRAEAERARKAALRRKEIIALAPDTPRLWAKVRELIERKLPAAYDEAMPVLADLRDIAAYKVEEQAFAGRVEGVATTCRNRPAFISRLKKAGLLPQDWRAS